MGLRSDFNVDKTQHEDIAKEGLGNREYLNLTALGGLIFLRSHPLIRADETRRPSQSGGISRIRKDATIQLASCISAANSGAAGHEATPIKAPVPERIEPFYSCIRDSHPLSTQCTVVDCIIFIKRIG
ncbi:hypothetical protein K449DRAFT_467414 [Hypoxylon sp. EC38]|nr:hypothetical protein K449DRAFT_467414 [Hypoxylon sp. EC38]